MIIRRLLANAQDIIVLDLDELKGGTAGEGKELDVAVLFADIRDFTAHSEHSLPYDAARTAFRHAVPGDSSRVPKTAKMPSPMYLSIKPLLLSKGSAIAVK